MKVLIVNGKVWEIFGETAPELHPSLQVVDAPNDVEVGYEFDGVNFTAPTPPPALTVSVITKLQCKKQAVAESLWDTLKSAIASDPDIQEDWDLALNVNINEPSVQAMGVAMGKTPEELQTFFNQAALQ